MCYLYSAGLLQSRVLWTGHPFVGVTSLQDTAESSAIRTNNTVQPIAYPPMPPRRSTNASKWQVGRLLASHVGLTSLSERAYVHPLEGGARLERSLKSLDRLAEFVFACAFHLYPHYYMSSYDTFLSQTRNMENWCSVCRSRSR